MARPVARILIAEPDRLQLQLIDMLLAAGEYELVAVPTGREALEELKRSTPDLALLALDLPDISGDKICEKIRRVTRLTRMPMILVGPQAGRFGLSDAVRSRARTVGATLALPRPLGDKNLRERIQALLDAREASPPDVTLDTSVIDEALAELPLDPFESTKTERQTATPPASRGLIADPFTPVPPFDLATASDDPSQQALHHERETLRLENRQLKRKLSEARRNLALSVNPRMQRTIDELERRNRALLEALEESKSNGRGEGRGGGLFGRRK